MISVTIGPGVGHEQVLARRERPDALIDGDPCLVLRWGLHYQLGSGCVDGLDQLIRLGNRLPVYRVRNRVLHGPGD